MQDQPSDDVLYVVKHTLYAVKLKLYVQHSSLQGDPERVSDRDFVIIVSNACRSIMKILSLPQSVANVQ